MVTQRTSVPRKTPQRTTAKATTPNTGTQANRFSTPSRNQPKRIKRPVVTTRTRDPKSGLAQETHTTYEAPKEFAPKSGGVSARKRSPLASARESIPSTGVGLLAAEFFIALGLLALMFFAGGNKNLPDKIMSVIKRGTLLCLAFFILALISGAGENANKIAKAIGALIVVAILLTTPIYGTDSSGDPSGVLVDVDEIIKNDWVPSSIHSGDTSGAVPSTSTPATPAQGTRTLTQDALSKLIHAAIGSPAYNAVAAELRAFKSGEVWKVPGDAIVGLEDIGTHGISKAFNTLKSILGHIF